MAPKTPRKRKGSEPDLFARPDIRDALVPVIQDSITDRMGEKKKYDTQAEAEVRLRAIEAGLLGAPDPPDPDEEVARFGREECAAGRHDWDTDGEVDACCRPGCGFKMPSVPFDLDRQRQPDGAVCICEGAEPHSHLSKEMAASMNAEIAKWSAGPFHRIHLTEPMPPGITRVPTPSRHLMVVRDMDDVNDTGPMHKRVDFDQAVAGSLVKVAPVVTGEQHASIDWAAVEKRLREENGAAGVVIAPDVRKTPSQSKATRVGQAATVSADAAIREWAAGMPGVPPDELEDAVALAISLATAAGL